MRASRLAAAFALAALAVGLALLARDLVAWDDALAQGRPGPYAARSVGRPLVGDNRASA